MAPSLIERHVAGLRTPGMTVDLLDAGGQRYVRACGLAAPSPPWHQVHQDILIAIPAAYDACELDAFYLGLPYTFNSGAHPRVNGGTIEVAGRRWQLVSWHYPEVKPWRRGQDDIASHIVHCSGFFLGRGAVNAY